MSMPKIEKSENPIDREQSVNNLIESIALMETGLSHIINAEGEKIQKVIKVDDPNTEVPLDNIIKVNQSVERMVSNISKLEMILQNKLDLSKDLDKISDNSNSGAIIPYTGYMDLSTLVDGRPGLGALANFAFLISPIGVSINGNPEILDIPYNRTAFSNPRNGILTSFSVYFYVTESHALAQDTQVVARLYMAKPNSTTFNPIKDAIIYLKPKINPDVENGELTGFINNLNVEIPANYKIVLLFYIYANDNSGLYGVCGGGINIK